MIVTQITRTILAQRRYERDMERAGWERVSEFGSPLWDLQRGARYDHEITQVTINADGKSLWVKIKKLEE